ncbi:MAG: hypothetical protein A2W93_11540 [Bacteroidetes bacterium GWF2_43_63]|nr:MAG: hypothetical protein A2W94_14415 [Bacteroidetes bacterium GWE2_42_42]OFY54903.1 MAG: hypothetical protein A2W93_11540 [Bacteroidetes bacterium GWF2_43_63]HCB63189.1 hypothetical protein [Bacteroidales bacterium]HCY22206.1 hypothetical protein [Bacteroidales bacterium]
MVNKFTKSIFICALLMISLVGNVHAQEEKQPVINIKTNPFASMLNMIPLSVEAFITNDFSASANVFIISSSNGMSETYFEQGGFGISPEMRYYFTDNVINGHKNRVYAAALYSYEQGTNATLDRYDNPIPGWSHAVGGALLIGNQWFFKNRFTVDLFLGPAYMSYVKNEDFDTNLSKGGFFLGMLGSKATGTRVKFGFNIGIAF